MLNFNFLFPVFFGLDEFIQLSKSAQADVLKIEYRLALMLNNKTSCPRNNDFRVKICRICQVEVPLSQKSI